MRKFAMVMLGLLTTCFTALVVASSAPTDTVQTLDALGLAFNQDGAPIALRGYLASQGSFLYETAKVENLSAKPISALSFAVLVADPAHRPPQPPTIVGGRCDAAAWQDTGRARPVAAGGATRRPEAVRVQKP